ncbi:hypothetical protein GH714_022010 [Hevea brasiliensis]|uniref:Uncharacterized protein n=1 Tax=Hevea brasiliensis TaxID=3981 RepID=A0A6A6MYD7_HEVBR|nr:hypothetical protein GH714_022010 [Hevea brasiliensis]
MPGVSFEDEPKKGLAALRSVECSGFEYQNCRHGGLSKASAMRCVWRNLKQQALCCWRVAKGRGGLTSLQSAEVFDPYTGMWSEIPSMPFPRLRRIYDPELNAWEMPTGMGGLAVKQAGTKLSVTVEDELYALEPSSSLDSARIKVYDYRNDAWKILLGDIPICDTSNSQSSYLLAGLLGKLHVITKDANNIIRVLQVDVRNHLASSSSSSAFPFDDSRCEEAESAAKPETVFGGSLPLKMLALLI